MNSSGWPSEPEHRLRGGKASNKEDVVVWSATLVSRTKKTTSPTKKTNKVIKAKVEKARRKSTSAGSGKRTTTSGHKVKEGLVTAFVASAAAADAVSASSSNGNPKLYKLGKQASGGITVATRRGLFRF